MLVVPLVSATPMLAGVAGASPPARHCTHPLGFDMNEVSGTDHRIVPSFCPVAYVGERWTPAASWTTNTTYEAIPEGYTPSRSTPMEDSLAKFVEGGYVIDAGTGHERTFSFPAAEIVQLVSAPGSGVPTAAIMPVLPPLPPGPHTVDIFFVLNAAHWDAFGTDRHSMLPAGVTHCSHIEFTGERRNR